MARRRNRKIDYKKNLKVYVELAKKYKWYFAIVIFFVLIVESIRLLEKFLFKIVIDEGEGFISGKVLLDSLVFVLLIVAIVFVSSIVVKLIFRWVQESLINRLDAHLMYDLKVRFFNHIVHLSHKFHTTHKTGSMISRLARGSRAVERVTDFFIYQTLPLFVQLLVVGAALLIFDWVSALIVFLTMTIFIGYALTIFKLQYKANLIANIADDREKANISDVFTNIDSVKYFGKEEAIKHRFATLSRDTSKKFVRFWNYSRLFQLGQTAIVAIGTFFIVYFPLLKFLDGGITIGTLAFIYTAYIGFLNPIYGFVYGVRGFFSAMADLDTLVEYEKIESEIKDKPNAKKLIVKEGAIEFKNISFKYYKKGLFKNFSLKIEPGEKVALVGYSGSGKTSLVKLLYRLYNVDSGVILIDGEDIREFQQESLRSELSIVPQEAILFDDTIYNNIMFPSPKASRAEVMKAMKFAQLDKFVQGLPKKEKTIVGERGIRLSGGEKQRVSIARAILANKKVLVLDEATSSLDSKTEHEIQRDLQKLMEGRTSIIIAHRLSTIMKADKIVVLDKGKIVQMGKHRDLIKRKGVYSELWNLQKGGFIE